MQIVSGLCDILRHLQGLELLLHVGQERHSDVGKIDLLAGCTDGHIEQHASLVGELLRNQWPTGSFSVCDDSVRFNLSSGGNGGIAICDSTLLVRQIEEWVEGKNLGGQHRPWATGYWLPEALCGDIATAKSLCDMKGIHSRMKKLLVPYPSSLSQSIDDLCVEEIKQKLETLKMLLGEDSPIERCLCLSDITASMIRLAFARSQCYFRGFRFLAKQARQLKSSDILIYELALEFSKSERTRTLIDEIAKLT